jgi:hypothetical protein
MSVLPDFINYQQRFLETWILLDPSFCLRQFRHARARAPRGQCLRSRPSQHCRGRSPFSCHSATSPKALRVFRSLPSILPRGAILTVCPGDGQRVRFHPDGTRVRSRPFIYCHSAIFRTSAMLLGESHLFGDQLAALSGSVFYVIELPCGGRRLRCGRLTSTLPSRQSANTRQSTIKQARLAEAARKVLEIAASVFGRG